MLPSRKACLATSASKILACKLYSSVPLHICQLQCSCKQGTTLVQKANDGAFEYYAVTSSRHAEGGHEQNPTRRQLSHAQQWTDSLHWPRLTDGLLWSMSPVINIWRDTACRRYAHWATCCITSCTTLVSWHFAVGKLSSDCELRSIFCIALGVSHSEFTWCCHKAYCPGKLFANRSDHTCRIKWVFNTVRSTCDRDIAWC